MDPATFIPLMGALILLLLADGGSDYTPRH